jgi:hypothetical protein
MRDLPALNTKLPQEEDAIPLATSTAVDGSFTWCAIRARRNGDEITPPVQRSLIIHDRTFALRRLSAQLCR